MKRELPVVITSVVAALYVVASFLDIKAFNVMKSHLDKWFLIISASTILLGVINLYVVHASAIRRRKPGFVYSIILLAALAFTLILGLQETSQGRNYAQLYQYVLNPLSSTMYAILCFYIASAAYRAFRMRSVDAALLLGTAVIVMIGVVPLGDVLWQGFPKLSQWLLDVPNTAGMRGIMIGATLGAIATGIRILLGLERSHFGRAE